MSEQATIEVWKEILSRAEAPGAKRFDLATLEELCHDDGVLSDVGEFPPYEIREVIREMRRMTPVIVAALAWRSDRTTAGWLAEAVDEYRRQRRAAGIEPAREE